VSNFVAGLVLDYDFHKDGRWVAPTCTPRLVDELIKRFNCVLMTKQAEFDRYYKEVDFLISMEPGWASPVLDYRRRFCGIPTRSPKLSYVFFSDPHREKWRETYFFRNKISFVLAFYYKPLLYHFNRIPRDRIIHFPWCIPEDYISTGPIVYHGSERIACYGASRGEAYHLRNWCRTFDFVDSKSYSGVENRVLSDEEFLSWLKTLDAAIAAGSDSPDYRLTIPKYFEIPASGALLFAQETDDLDRLGFLDMVNCVVFNRKNFTKKARDYLADPEICLRIRDRGRDLIRTRHSLSVRMDMFEQHVLEHLK